MSYFYDLTPQAVSVPVAGQGLVQGFAESLGPRLDAYRAEKADENQWRDTLNAFPENPGGFSRAQMFALGRDPKYRDIAIEMLTGRMKPQQFMGPAQPAYGARPFGPSRMAADVDYHEAESGGAYFNPYSAGWMR
ncbi:hypothetical protein IZ6_10990 [Terrihabitans soli]|uniref:Uncharacterized protein n=1 Tax=Terrihabitans soli TaxID=708113 RepID=A0A6S6QJB1_9HYPH|nr:hypothetical protein [Terrihabitans soli]BCJ90364.1 hypothetical protein IZ6_10990 [Terrihabitans soli]